MNRTRGGGEGGYNNSSTNIQEVLLDFRTLLEGEGREGQTNLKLAPRRGTLQIERNNYEIKPFNQTISIGIFYNCFLPWNKETLKILQFDFFYRNCVLYSDLFW